MSNLSGILLVDKAKGNTSFKLVSILRKLTNISKIGHSGTLDPFATGLMVMLIGKNFTKQSNLFINHDKEYISKLHLGYISDSFDPEGVIEPVNNIKPTLEEIQLALKSFQGTISQIPPMFSAKKIKGKKLYELARKGITVKREPQTIFVETYLLDYNYPYLDLRIACSKGTYIRAIAHDLGQLLGCGAYLTSLSRTRSGPFHLKDAVSQNKLLDHSFDISPWLKNGNI